MSIGKIIQEMKKANKYLTNINDLFIRLTLSYKMTEKESYIGANQEFWRNAKRGILSRPLELPKVSELLHSRITKTFNLEDAQKPIVTFAMLWDDPKSPSSKFVHAERYPEEITEEDRPAFMSGISKITEYATNLAAREFFRTNTDFPIGRTFAELYGMTSDAMTYKILMGATYREMSRIEMIANNNGKDYKGAITQALFQHDFTQINELISDTSEFSGLEDINDLAIQLGKKKFKKIPSLGNSLDSRKGKDSINWIKNCVVSALAAGLYRNPGVTEISGASYALFPGITFLTAAIYLELNKVGIFSEYSPEVVPLVAATIAESVTMPTVVVTGLLPFVAVHESIHHYSSDENFMGMIPSRIINKEVTPYKARLEPKD